MGTTYLMEGRISIEPPLNYTEIQAANKVAEKTVAQAGRKRFTENVWTEILPLKLDIETNVRHTDEGPLTVTRATGLVPPKADWWLACNMDDFVCALIRALPGHRWEGTVTALHEDRLTGTKVEVNVDNIDGKKLPIIVPGVYSRKGDSYMHWEDGDQDKVADLF